MKVTMSSIQTLREQVKKIDRKLSDSLVVLKDDSTPPERAVEIVSAHTEHVRNMLRTVYGFFKELMGEEIDLKVR